MPDPEKSAAAVRSDAVDAEFWAIVLQDEEWLRAEFDGIAEPAETRISPPRPLTVGAGQSFFGGQRPAPWPVAGMGRFGDTGRAPGQGWRRQRSPPPAETQPFRRSAT
jgi:hypothetical protein